MAADPSSELRAQRRALTVDLLDLLRRTVAAAAGPSIYRMETPSADGRKFPLSFDDLVDAIERFGATYLPWGSAESRPSPTVASLLESERVLPPLPDDDIARIIIDDRIFYMLQRQGRKDAAGIILGRYDIPHALPVVDRVLGQFQHGRELHDTVVVACQHLLGSVFAQMVSLRNLGVLPENCYILGKPYSSSRPVYEMFARAGFNIFKETVDFPATIVRSRKFYDEFMRQTLENISHAAIERATALREVPRLLLIDDGGLLIDTFENLARHAAGPLDIMAIEQTRGGILRLDEREEEKRRFSVINVAQCRAKLRTESPLIAESVVDHIQQRLDYLGAPRRRLIRDQRFLVLGYGAVGAWIAKELRSRRARAISVFDTDAARLAIAAANDLETPNTQQQALRSADVVIAATGHSSLQLEALNRIRRRMLLVSAGSSNREFGAFIPEMRVWGRMPAFDHEPSPFALLHGDYAIRARGVDAIILNGGFPVNFDGSIDPISPARIQLTRGLMVGACIQASTISRWRVGSPEVGRLLALRGDIDDFVESEALSKRAK